MIIKRIQLENYRSHSNIIVEFSKGINLILGKNGKGKSSILEAISTVMFNTKDRSGKELKKNYIKFGEKYSKINIDFIANDDREYSLKTEFFQKKFKKQILEDNAGNIYEEDIQEKLEELCGIKKGFEETYENVIIAKQNEFINIFKAKPRDREEIFNKIFNTHIYKEMYDNFLKEAIDKYKFKKESLENEINFLKESMESKEETLIFLKEEEKLKEEAKKELSEITVVLENLFNNIKKYETTEFKLKNLIFNIKEEENKIKKYLNILKENIIDAKQAKKSKKITETTEKFYFEYLEVDKKLKNSRESLQNLLEEQKLNTQYQHNIEKLEIDNKNLKIDISKLRENISKNIEIKEKLEKEFSELEIKEQKLKILLKEYVELYKNLAELEVTKQEQEENKLKKQTEIEIIQKELDLKNILFEVIDIEEIEKKIIYFLDIEEELENLNKQKIIFETEIETLKKSSKELTDKMCPFLNEKCENLKNRETEDYFSNKILSRTIKLKKIKEFIEEKIKILIEKSAFENNKKRYFELKKLIEDLKHSLKNKEIDLKEIELKIKEQDININKLIGNKNISNSSMLREKKKELEVELRNLKLNEKKENLDSLIKNLGLEKSKVLKNQGLIENNLKRIEDYLKKIKVDTDKFIDFFKGEVENQENKLNSLKEPYSDYLKNNKLAEELEAFLIKVKKSIEELYSLRKNKNFLKEKRFILENEMKSINIDELREKYNINRESLADINKKIGSYEEKIENYNKILKKISLQEEKQKKMFGEFKNLDNKLNKANLIRNEVGQMGRAISKYMLNRISNLASVNFNKITGRNERIEWSNEEKDKYDVYLVGQGKRIAFEQLSGGEQVSVAIAIRGTMTEYFTNSKFMILDEPTNNLDTERKKLLAEYMGEILNNLDQSIIVTHDDTFREMAEKIIEL